MVITKQFYFRGWLPAGLVINSRLLSSQPDDGTAVMIPIINSNPGTTWPVQQPRPTFPIAQATDISAIVLKDPIPESTLVMLPLGDWYGPGTPYVLAINTWYDGVIQAISGDDVSAVRIIMHEMHLYLSMDEMDPGSLPDACVGEMPARILAGSRRKSALFIDPGAYTEQGAIFGWPPKVSMGQEEVSARLMNYLTIKQIHTAGLAQGVLKDPGFEDNDVPDSFLKCSLAGGRVTPPPHAGRIRYYGIMPVVRENVQPMFPVGAMSGGFTIGEPTWGAHPNLLNAGLLANSSLAATSESGDDQVVHYN